MPLKAYGLVSGAPQKGSVDGSDPNNGAAFPFTVTDTTKAVQVTSQTDDPDAAAAVILIRGDLTHGTIVAFGDVASRSNIVESGLEPGGYALGNAPGTTTTPFTYRGNIVDASDADGSLTVSPALSPTGQGEPFTATAEWNGAAADAPATGYVEYPDSAGTVISVN